MTLWKISTSCSIKKFFFTTLIIFGIQINCFIQNGITLHYAYLKFLNTVKYTKDISKKDFIVICLAGDVQEEIECLYEFVPEVDHHFVVIDKIGEGKCYYYREICQYIFYNFLIVRVDLWMHRITLLLNKSLNNIVYRDRRNNYGPDRDSNPGPPNI